MKKILVGGDSFTYNSKWPELLFPDCEIINLGRSGAGNRFIADSVIDYVSRHKVDQVFVLWSAINRVDIPVPVSEITDSWIKSTRYYGKINDTYYWFSGKDKYNSVINKNYKNIKDPSWPTVKSIDDFVVLPLELQAECYKSNLFGFELHSLEGKMVNYVMLNYLNSKTYLEDMTWKNVLNCQNALEVQNIPYNFGFIFEPFSADTVETFGKLQQNHPLYRCIHWDKYVKLSPYNYAVRHDLLAEDMFHMSFAGQIKWAQEIKQFVKQ